MAIQFSVGSVMNGNYSNSPKQDVTWHTIESLFTQLCLVPPIEHGDFFEANQVDEELKTLLVKMVGSIENTNPILNGGIKRAFTNVFSEVQRRDWVGQKLDEFSITKVLGAGGAGIVLKAEQDNPVKRDVAIKVLYKQAPDSFDGRFSFEQASLARLNHPNIATIYSVGSSPEGFCYLAMEYIDGKTLLEHCDNQRLSIQHRLSLFSQICGGISFSHQHGILHRDIKPENILVRDLKTEAIPVVIDFGIASELGPQSEEQIEEPKIGTPEYMSPESLLDDSQVDVRSDIYSLGMLLFSLLIGKPGFNREKFASANLKNKHRALEAHKPESMQSHLSNIDLITLDEVAKFRKLTALQFRKAVSEEVDWIYKKATATDIDHRYSSVSEMIEDLNRLSRNMPITAAPNSKSYASKKFIQRNKVASASASILLAFMCIFAIVMWNQNQTILQQYAFAEEQRELAEAQKKIATTEKQSAEQISRLLTEIFTTYNPRFTNWGSQDQELTVADIVEKGRDRIYQDENLAPEVKFPLLFTLAYTYFGLSKSNESIAILQKLLDRKLWPNQSFDAGVHWLISRSYGLDNIPDKAFFHAEQAYALLDNSEVEESRKLEIISNLSTRYQEIHDYDNALVYSLQSRYLADDLYGESSYQAIQEQAYYATLLMNKSQFNEAKGILQNSLLNFQKLPEAQQSMLAEMYILTQLSETLSKLGDYADSIKYQGKAVDIGKEIFGEEHKQYLTVLNGLASYYSFAGFSEKSIILGEKIIELSEQVDGPESMNYLIHKANLGLRYILAGKYIEGEKHLSVTLKLSLKHHPNDIINLAYVYSNLALAAMGLKELPNAKSYIDKALKRFEQTVGTQHMLYGTSLMYSALIDFNLKDFDNGLLSLWEAKDLFDTMISETHKYVIISDIAFAYSQAQSSADIGFSNRFKELLRNYVSRDDSTTNLAELFESWEALIDQSEHVHED